MVSTFSPTCNPTLRVTAALSPVRILIVIPSCLRFSITALALSLGGSKNAKNPIKVNSLSSSTENSPTGAGFILYPNKTTLNPSSFISAISAKICFFL